MNWMSLAQNRASGGLLWAQQWTFESYKMLRNCLVAERLVPSQGLVSMELVSRISSPTSSHLLWGTPRIQNPTGSWELFPWWYKAARVWNRPPTHQPVLMLRMRGLWVINGTRCGGNIYLTGRPHKYYKTQELPRELKTNTWLNE
jgi:hypothetical protein